MRHIDECQRILDSLNGNLRLWGRYIDSFFENYRKLTETERSALKANTEMATRFSLMHQYLGHFRTQNSVASDDEYLVLLENCLNLIELDNFEYDYRETLLRFERFIERAERRPKLFMCAWAKLSGRMPERAFNAVKNRPAMN